jgi:hypothetical protein
VKRSEKVREMKKKERRGRKERGKPARKTIQNVSIFTIIFG